MQLLVLNASALNLGFFGCYGNAWIATPHLDSFAAESVVFDQHFAENLTQPAGAWSSSFIQRIKTADVCDCTHVAAKDSLGSCIKNIVKGLKSLARQPAGLCWVDLPSLYPPWTVEDEFLEPYLAPVEDDNQTPEGEPEPPQPLLDPPIGPFDAKDLTLWERLRGAYGGAITRMDAALGELFDELRKRELYDQLVVIFTADRGLALGEHGFVGDCRPWLHDEVVHLPLIMRFPDQAEAGRRVFGLSQPADLAATLLEILGRPGGSGTGQSLLTLMRGTVESVREMSITRWKLGEAEEWSLRTSDCALLLPIIQPPEWPPRPTQFYVKPEDRWEVNNVIQHHLDLADELEKTLRAAAV